MSLRDAPLLYVFFETSNLAAERQLLESRLGFPVIEVEPHMPHHRHGVVKYDAGGMILSLNLTDELRFHRGTTDALVTAIEVGRDRRSDDGAQSDFVQWRGSEMVDAHGHHFAIDAAADPAAAPRVTELRLIVDDLAGCAAFYEDVLLLRVRDRRPHSVRYAAGGVDLVLEARTRAREQQQRRDTYLIVFYTPDIAAAQQQLAARGAPFKRPRPGFSEIGGSSRFADPAGNHLCLYQPSLECLGWGSGPKVMEVAHIEGGVHAR